MKRQHLILGVFASAMALASPTSFGQWDEILRRGKEAFGGQTEPRRQIAHFQIKGPLTETPVGMPPLFGGEAPLSLKSILERFKEARLDSNVVAVVVDLEHAVLGVAQLEEIHSAMKKFSSVDKPVYVHADSLATLSYVAATGASHISLVPTGDVWLVVL